MKVIHVYPVPCEYAYPAYLDAGLDPDAFDTEIMCKTDLELRYLKGLREKGVDCTLLYPRRFRPGIKEFRHRAGYRIVRFPISFLERRKGSLSLGMLRYISREKPDLVHFHSIYQGGFFPVKMLEMVALTCASRKIPLFGWYHVGRLRHDGPARVPAIRALYAGLRAATLKTLAGISSINREELRRLFDPEASDYYGIDFSRIPHRLTPNTYDPSVFHPMDREEATAGAGLDPRYRYIVMVARLFPQKGLHHLLNVLPEIVAEFPDARLVVVGEFIEEAAEYARQIDGQIDSLNLRRYVLFKGRIEHDQGLVHYLNSADVFVLPTLKETFGGVNIEAMACGIPVISTDCGEIPNYLTGGVGRLVPKGDEAMLLQAVKDVLSGRFRADENERRRVLARYDYRTASGELLDWYNEILDHRKTGAAAG